MAITDELREWIRSLYTPNSAELKVKGMAIADRIEDAHRSAVNAAYDDGMDECRMDVAEGMVELPLDADGVPIHVGDVVTMDLAWGGKSKPLVADRMELSRGKDGELWCIALDTDDACWNQPSLMHHYHPPTVEDVLREFADKLDEMKGYPPDEDGVVSEYAAKLRLAGEDE